MHSLYTEQDLASLRGQIRRRFFFLSAVLLAGLILIAVTLMMDNHKTNRPELLTALAVILTGAAVIFVSDMLIRPLKAYEKFMDHALHGRVHQASVIFDHMTSDVSVVDGVRFRDMVFLGDADKHGDRDRLFYWDQELSLPSFDPGQEVTLCYFDRFITGYQV